MILFLACTGTPEPIERPPVVEAPVAACADYAHDLATYEFCVLKEVQRVPEDGVRAHCQGTGVESDCLHAWVSWNRDGPSVDQLLAICSNDDCRLEVLDHRPAELPEQMERCRRHAGHLGPDCAGHAGQRWANSATLEDIQAAKELKVAYPGKLAWWIGVALHCGDHGSCEGMPAGCEPGRSWARSNPNACGGG